MKIVNIYLILGIFLIVGCGSSQSSQQPEIEEKSAIIDKEYNDKAIKIPTLPSISKSNPLKEVEHIIN
ncbi:hypothetical protein GJV85_01585 [Sulfurimonas aquatica]|uniref:Uncharacterized protein n=1 Tax=Sulfurimonas aquatica TaxID=2672570 RepID=A0A975AYK2_9BACT|nr:hypothetical protein [Sulfurimonas aquatica]QSZ40860.1 hypothetical protein GJV85_01585 [Sulfurimonas aquatica]